MAEVVALRLAILDAIDLWWSCRGLDPGDTLGVTLLLERCIGRNTKERGRRAEVSPSSGVWGRTGSGRPSGRGGRGGFGPAPPPRPSVSLITPLSQVKKRQMLTAMTLLHSLGAPSRASLPPMVCPKAKYLVHAACSLDITANAPCSEVQKEVLARRGGRGAGGGG